ncbi:hypothetical protein [Halomonas caseinilytica]|uniref:hypothetical protein n=1 Tax=Halomonas caseinilytica TaxID=438744 RepID=UPI0008486C50|nr:hypothetical protein [Halomonas caseinilytica]
MGLKKLLWNDNATELFGHRRDQNEHVAPERPEEGSASHRPYTARKVLKGSAAFTSALLFGTEESQGLVRTLSEASAEAVKNIFKSQRQADIECALRNHEQWRKEQAQSGKGQEDTVSYYGPEGSGAYMNGVKID